MKKIKISLEITLTYNSEEMGDNLACDCHKNQFQTSGMYNKL